MSSKHVIAALVLSLAPVAAPLPSLAQSSTIVEFEPGNYGTLVQGTIQGQDYADYKLAAGKGQQMFAELTVDSTNGNGTIYFNILPPGSDGVAIYNGSMDGNSALITLPEKGTYTIRVYLMGNDSDTNKRVSFNLDLSIQ